ncbi:MAG: rhodanese-like domain-containing protein [Geobacteraceae bacterium]|jgi:rhodanese-related sulfurtransferase
MKNNYKKLIFEMTVIVLLAVTIGIIWNYRLLREISTGRASVVTSPPEISAAPTATLIPAGLAQVKELFDTKNALFIDARESSVFQQGHIQGSTSFPLATLETILPGFLNKVPFETNLVLYCGGYGCHDSKDLGQKLLQLGYRQIFVFEGGYPEWKDAGFPIAGANQ